jgi:hypothetical protein
VKRNRWELGARVRLDGVRLGGVRLGGGLRYLFVGFDVAQLPLLRIARRRGQFKEAAS